MADREKTKQIRIGGTGISLILVVFVIVMLIVLAVLSVSASEAGVRIADRYETMQEAYYEARNEEQAALAELDGALLGAFENAGDQEEYMTLAGESLPDGWTLQEDGTYLYTISCSDSQELLVCIEITWPDENNGLCYRLVSDMTQSTEDFDYDESLSVLKKSDS